MKNFLFILYTLPALMYLKPTKVEGQVQRDSIAAIRGVGDTIKYVVYYPSSTYTSGDDIMTRSAATGNRGTISPLELPIATLAQNALNLKLNTTDTSALARKVNPTFTGIVSQENATLRSQKYYLTPITTTNSTPVLLGTIPIPQNKSYDIDIYMMAVKSDGTTRNCGYIRGVFSRITGNISQDGSLKNDLLGVLSTSKCTFVINNTTKEVEIYANGLNGNTINWNFFVEITNLL